jgi:hypothetical protein
MKCLENKRIILMNKTWWGEYNSSFFLPTWNMSFARLLMRDF